ncbi:putative GDP/GTP exchange factor Sec2 N-terminal domain-containing protein [Seiridium cardinale]
MSESSAEEIEPQTPPRYPNRPQHHGDDTYELSPPPASPSLSFNSLGRSPFSPLGRQSSAQHAPTSHSPESNHDFDGQPDVTEDSKDVLIQRLNDLVARLSAEDGVQGASVDFMHTKMDELEKELDQGPGGRPRRHKRNQSSLSTTGDNHGIELGASRPTWLKSHLSEITLLSPGSQAAATQPEVQESPTDQHQAAAGTNTDHLNLVLAEARKLQSALEIVATNLKARQEEQEHIHDLLITRAERAAQRIIYLEGRVGELENERNEGEMEVLNLQIQLKAIEVQCLSYVPKDADPDLLESIKTWKDEWSALKRKKALSRGDNVDQGSPKPRGSRRQVLRSTTAE